MKRLSLKNTISLLRCGASIHDNAFFTLNAGFRVNQAGCDVGYITLDQFLKLRRAEVIKKTAAWHSLDVWDFCEERFASILRGPIGDDEYTIFKAVMR